MYRYLIIALIAGIIGNIIAQKKGQNPVLWFILCTIIPLLVLVVMVLPPTESKGYTKKCPLCAEIIREDAKICRHCGYIYPK